MADNEDEIEQDEEPSPQEPPDVDDDGEPVEDEESDADILALAKKRWKISEEAESEIRKEALEDLKFRSGDQWPSDVKVQRDQDRRPCLTVNRLPQYGRQVVNDIRQNPTEIKVNPVDDVATIETAKVLQGLIRHILYISHADAAFDTAAECAVNGSFGYFRVTTDFEDESSFNQEIYVKRIRDPFSARLDAFAQETDGSDAKWGFVEDVMSEEDYKDEFPESELAKANMDWGGMAKTSAGWLTKDSCRVVEYFYKVPVKTTACLLSNGRTCLKEELPEPMAPGVTVVKERPTTVYKVKWCKLNTMEVLEKRDWPGKFIPIIPVYGNELIVDGKRILESLIRYAKDPQRMSNYWASALTEGIALAPKAPFIIAEGQIEGFEDFWQTANTKNHSYLPYKAADDDGRPMPPPQRSVAEPAVQAIVGALMQSKEDLKETTGIYDTTLGMRSNEQSGVAIQRRNAQSQISNFHFVDNLSRAIKHLGCVLLDLMPKIYDVEMAKRILKDDGTPEVVLLNKMFAGPDGKPMSHSLDAGKYDVTISTGPGYQTKRQEFVAMAMDFVKGNPAAFNMVADLLFKNMDVDGSQEIAARFKAMLPPQVLQQENGGKPTDPQAQAMIQKLSAQNTLLQQHLNDTTAYVNTKKQELTSKEKIEFEKMKTELVKKVMELDSKEAMHQFTMATDHIDRQVGLTDQNQNLLNAQGAGQMPPQAANQNQQQPTGGPSPG